MHMQLITKYLQRLDSGTYWSSGNCSLTEHIALNIIHQVLSFLKSVSGNFINLKVFVTGPNFPHTQKFHVLKT